MQKLIVLLYASSEQSECEIKSTILFTIAPEIKYFGVNLTKDVKELNIKEYKLPLMKIKFNKTRVKPYSWAVRLNIIIISTLLKLIYEFNEILIKLPAGFFVEINELIIRFMWKCKGYGLPGWR